ncbi:MAG: hypothetical protein NZ561_07505, partial [Phycisphaerae bacterium]|nr:hypothetical protein [Phycisphaerae bacterium]
MQVRTAIGQLAPLTLLKGSITLRIVRPAIAVFLSSLVLLSVPLLLGINAPPSVHDEFAFLLQADTFARGRLANPPHRHWEFFETMHVLQQPTYAAKFPPGQGLAMAAGQKLGNPRYGVILSVALACGATAWLAAGCLPPRWAKAAGLLAATHPLVFSWGQSFWGGGMAMLGGALTIGAMLRLARRASWIDGAVLGLGIAILLNSRPFEGVLLLISAMVGLGWIARWRLGLVVRAPIVIPVLTILSATGAWMVLYNYRVTGHPLRLPDLEYTRQYMAAPRFWWMAANAQKTYRHPAMEAFHRGSEYQEYLRQTTIRGFLHAQWEKIAEIARDWLLRPPMASIVLLPALVLALMRFRRGLWLATTLGSVPVLEMLLTPWFRPHYLAVVV